MSLKTNILNAFGWFLAECKKKFAPISHTHSDYSLISHNHSGVYQPAGSYAAASHNHNFLTKKGDNIISAPASDTTFNWGNQYNSVHFYSKTGCLNGQPGQYGYLLNFGQSSEVHQIWLTQANGNMCHRGGNASGWSGGWKTILDNTNYATYLNNKYQGKGSYAASNHNHNGVYAAASHGHNGIAYNGHGWVTNENGMLRCANVAHTGKQNIGTGDNYIKDLNYSGALNKRSDKRYKNPLGDVSFQDVKPVLENLQIRKFTYKSDDYKILNYGVYAQDLRDIMIEHNLEHNSLLQISTTGDEYCSPVSDLTTPEELVTYGIDYSQMSPMLLLGWQNHNKRLEELEKTVNELKKENEILKKKIMASA